jgi:hypothetical protein
VLNAEYIQNNIDKEERLFRLHTAAQNQLLIFEKKQLNTGKKENI